ncbi:hypothetical protein BCR33DRAFT_718585, partial [Rhizoclosmatium globosum]
DVRDVRDARDIRDVRDRSREMPRDVRDVRDARERPPRDYRDIIRDGREVRDGRDAREPRDHRGEQYRPTTHPLPPPPLYDRAYDRERGEDRPISREPQLQSLNRRGVGSLVDSERESGELKRQKLEEGEYRGPAPPISTPSSGRPASSADVDAEYGRHASGGRFDDDYRRRDVRDSRDVSRGTPVPLSRRPIDDRPPRDERGTPQHRGDSYRGSDRERDPNRGITIVSGIERDRDLRPRMSGISDRDREYLPPPREMERDYYPPREPLPPRDMDRHYTPQRDYVPPQRELERPIVRTDMDWEYSAPPPQTRDQVPARDINQMERQTSSQDFKDPNLNDPHAHPNGPPSRYNSQPNLIGSPGRNSSYPQSRAPSRTEYPPHPPQQHRPQHPLASSQFSEPSTPAPYQHPYPTTTQYHTPPPLHHQQSQSHFHESGGTPPHQHRYPPHHQQQQQQQGPSAPAPGVLPPPPPKIDYNQLPEIMKYAWNEKEQAEFEKSCADRKKMIQEELASRAEMRKIRFELEMADWEVYKWERQVDLVKEQLDGLVDV